MLWFSNLSQFHLLHLENDQIKTHRDVSFPKIAVVWFSLYIVCQRIMTDDDLYVSERLGLFLVVYW